MTTLEARVSEDVAAYADQICRIHDEVKAAIEANNEYYKEAANQHRCFKDLAEGDQVLVHLKRERFPKGAFHKLTSRKIVKKISSNAHIVELPEDLQISPIFNVADLFEFHGFDDMRLSNSVNMEWTKQIPKMPREVIDKFLDMKEAQLRRGHKYCRFLIKGLCKPATESTWISEEKLTRIDVDIQDEYIKIFSFESSFSSPHGN